MCVVTIVLVVALLLQAFRASPARDGIRGRRRCSCWRRLVAVPWCLAGRAPRPAMAVRAPERQWVVRVPPRLGHVDMALPHVGVARVVDVAYQLRPGMEPPGAGAFGAGGTRGTSGRRAPPAPRGVSAAGADAMRRMRRGLSQGPRRASCNRPRFMWTNGCNQSSLS